MTWLRRMGSAALLIASLGRTGWAQDATRPGLPNDDERITNLERAVDAIQARRYVGGLVSFAPSHLVCSQDGPSSCQTKSLIGVALAEGQLVSLKLNPQAALEEVFNVTMEKLPGPSGSGTDYSVQIKVFKEGWPLQQSTVSPTAPVYSAAADPTCVNDPSQCPLNFLARLMSDSLLTLEIEPADVPVLEETQIESYGAILQATARYYKGGDQATLRIVIWNAGEYKANYVVSAECVAIAPVAAQSRTLDIQQTGIVVFPLRASGPVVSGNTCKVILRAPTGRLYDTMVVPIVLPPPGPGAPRALKAPPR